MTDLHDLLDQRARQGSVHPSIEGVHDAVDRRKARRNRHRALGGGIAAVCLLAGVLGGVALSSGDDTVEQPMTAGGREQPPIVGIDADGWVLTDAHVEPMATEEDGQPVTAVTFRRAGSLAGPLVNVAVESGLGDEVPVEVEDRPLDLDGDGTEDARVTATPSGGVGISWTLDDGRTVGVGGYGLPEPDVVDYASSIYGGDLDPNTVPAPDDLPDRSVSTIPADITDEQALATYRNGRRTLGLSTVNEPGWFDFLQLYTMSTYGGFEEADVGDAFFGPARAIVSEPRDGYGFALVRTESGLTISISTDGRPTSVDELRDLLAAGRFVELDPDNLVTAQPSSTTVAATATTVPITTTSVVQPGDASITDVRVGTHDGFDRVVIEFADVLPDTHDVTLADEPASGECVAPDLDGVAFVNIHLGLTSSGRDANEMVPYGEGDGPLLSVDRTCEFEAFVDIVVSLDRSVEPVVTELTSPQRLVIDLPE